MRPTRLLAVVAGGLCLGGCLHPANERLALGTQPTASFGGPAGPGVRGDGSPPRRAWSTRVEVVGIDGVVHSGTLRSPEYVGRRSDAVAAGAYPEPDATHERRGWEAWRAARTLGRTVGEVVLMPLRGAVGLIVDDRGWSPSSIWKRAPGVAVREGTIGADPARSGGKEPATGGRP